MSNCSKAEKLAFLSGLQENPNMMDKLRYLQLIFIPFYNPVKEYKGGAMPTHIQARIISEFDYQTTPEQIDRCEVARLERDEEAKDKLRKKCSNCGNRRDPEYFVPFYKTCLVEGCLDMTAEEATQKFLDKQKKKEEGIKCSTCGINKIQEDFGIKKDGSYKKTCIKCEDRKKKVKTPEMTPETPPSPVHDSETAHPNPQCEAKTEVSE
jgi:hypothetical protein